MTPPRCCLCAQIAGDPAADLLHANLGGAYQRRVGDIAPGLHLVPSLGALVPGHVLLCPGCHVRSYAQLNPPTMRRVESVVAELSRRLGAMTGDGDDVQVFEHGDARDSDRVSCSVEHAHLHLLPGVPDLWPMARTLCSWRPAASLEDGARVAGNGEYLLLRGLSGSWQVAPASAEGFPSQLLRRVVAQALGEPDTWNWRTHPRHHTTRVSWHVVRELMAA